MCLTRDTQCGLLTTISLHKGRYKFLYLCARWWWCVCVHEGGIACVRVRDASANSIPLANTCTSKNHSN